MALISYSKIIVKKIVGKQNYSRLLNTYLGTWIHNKLHENSISSRDFLLQKMPKKSICAEIGVHKGDFSERIIEIVQPKILFLIDPWKFEDNDIYENSFYGKNSGENQKIMDGRFLNVKKRFEIEIKKNQISVIRDYSTNVLEKFESEYLDWIYIDGNHLYEFVKNDLEISFKKVKNFGFICGDDYNQGGWWKGGVKKAVDEFIEKNKNIKLIEIKADQFVLQKII